MWTAEKETTLRQMWEGGYSASIIGNQLGYSRNAIIGKAHRLGLRRKGFKHTRHATGGRRPYKKRQRLAVITTDTPVIVRRRNHHREPEPTKDELRHLFETAWRNTATNGEQNETVSKDIHDPRRKHSVRRGMGEDV